MYNCTGLQTKCTSTGVPAYFTKYWSTAAAEVQVEQVLEYGIQPHLPTVVACMNTPSTTLEHLLLDQG